MGIAMAGIAEFLGQDMYAEFILIGFKNIFALSGY